MSDLLASMRFLNEITVLFQGDSITDGNRYKEESKRWDLNHQIGHAYPYIIASLLGSAAPERRFRFINRGVSGDTVSRMRQRWNEGTLVYRPDLLSILIGVNDVCSADTHDIDSFSEQFEETYRALLDEALAVKAEMRFVLIEPFLLKPGTLDEEWQTRYSRMKKLQEASRRIARDYRAVYVQTQSLFDSLCKCREAEYWVWDGVHPTEAGHGIIARQWLKATGLWETALGSGIHGGCENCAVQNSSQPDSGDGSVI